MKVSYYKLLLSLLGLTMLGAITSSVYSQKYPEWAIGPFKRYEGNPIMKQQGKFGTWESQNAYNPAVIVRDNRFLMLYRGENSDTTLFKHYRSQIGFAESEDGIHWKRYPNNPVH